MLCPLESQTTPDMVDTIEEVNYDYLENQIEGCLPHHIMTKKKINDGD